MRRTTLAGLPVAALALATLAACGTGTSATASGPGAAAAGGGADMAPYASCMAENGVTMPTPGESGDAPLSDGGATPPTDGSATPPTGQPPAGGAGGAGGPGGAGGVGGPGGAGGQAPAGVDQTTWEAAQQACADLAPTPPDGGSGAPATGTETG